LDRGHIDNTHVCGNPIICLHVKRQGFHHNNKLRNEIETQRTKNKTKRNKILRNATKYTKRRKETQRNETKFTIMRNAIERNGI
jgi:hypothetical protein